MRRRLHALLLFAGAFAGGASARECTCGTPLDDLESAVLARYEAADVVAVFEVAGTTRAPVMVGSRTYGGRWIELEARTVFKGPRRPGLRYYATASKLRSRCDTRYARGDLVLAYITAGQLADLSACSPSGPIAARADELDVLAALAPPPTP